MISTLLPVPIRKEVTIAASPERVWPLISTAEGLRRWWGATIDLEAKAGGRCEERGVLHGRPYALRGVVSTWEPPRHLVLSMQRVEGEGLAPIDSTIAIELRPIGPDGSATRVIVTHHLHDPLLEPAVAAGQPSSTKPGSGPQMGLSHDSGLHTSGQAIATHPAAAWRQSWHSRWQQRTQTLQELLSDDQSLTTKN